MLFRSWGFGNIINGYYYYGGLGVILPWILIFLLYFMPYTLMVGELGSAFKTHGGGVSSWVHETMGKKFAFYAGWTYWVVHIPYISQKPSSTLIAAGWLFFRDSSLSRMNATAFQLLALALFVVAILLSLRGLNFLKKISSIAGTAMFVMSILFILMMFAAPALNNQVSFGNIDWSWKTFVPVLDAKAFMNIAILVFAIGGCEKLSPYVNKMDRPAKDFPKGMIMLAIMVAVCAILGSIALGLMFSGATIDKDFLANGQYIAFQRVGQYYGLGDLLMIIYALCVVVVQISVIILSIDAPLRMLVESSDEEYIPRWLAVKNKRGVYKNGVLVVFIFAAILIIIPALGIGNVNDIIEYVISLNSVCMPLRYLWVFIAYFMMKKSQEYYPAEYRFVKGKKLGMFFGLWCFAITAYACIAKIFQTDGDMFKLVLNIITPFVLVGLGLILPAVARRTNKIK